MKYAKYLANTPGPLEIQVLLWYFIDLQLILPIIFPFKNENDWPFQNPEEEEMKLRISNMIAWIVKHPPSRKMFSATTRDNRPE